MSHQNICSSSVVCSACSSNGVDSDVVNIMLDSILFMLKLIITVLLMFTYM